MINAETPMSLDGLDLGAQGTIIRIGCPGPLRRRLMDMGLTPGTMVRLEGVAPLGDPIIVSARGCRLGLRRAEASGITVTPCPDSASTGRCPLQRRRGRRDRRGGRGHGWAGATSASSERRLFSGRS